MPVRQTWQMNAPSGNGGGVILGEPSDIKGRRLSGGLPWLLDMDVTNRVRLGDTVAGGRSGISAPTVPYGGWGVVGRTVTDAAVTVSADDSVIRCATTSNNITLNLPTAASMVDQVLELYKTALANSVIIVPNGSELINGVSTYTFTGFQSPIRIRSNGTSWDVLNNEMRFYDLLQEDNPTATNTGTETTLATSASFFFTGRPVLLVLDCSAYDNNATDEFMQMNFAVSIDAAASVKMGQLSLDKHNDHRNAGGNLIIVPTQGNHTISLKWIKASGAGIATMDFNDFYYLRGMGL